MQNEITSPFELLDDDGYITKEGWARRPYWRYDREKINASWYRIKEWDYYAVLSQERGYGITVTVSDLSFAAFCAVCWLDFKKNEYRQLDTMKLLTRGKTGFPSSSENGNVEYKDKKMHIRYEKDATGRRIIIDSDVFTGPGEEKGLKANLLLDQPKDLESMNIATSWKENRKAFYYNQKINCMPATGAVNLGGKEYDFSPDSEFGCLDWGRGRWTYKNRWYWSSASGLHKGVPFGFNLGYGFSDRTPATENVLFYDGKVHKLDDVRFEIDTEDYMKPWKFISNDGRFEMDFIPAIDRKSRINLLLIATDQHQVFGYFTGTATLDDGTVLEVDNMLGFAEDVYNRL